uniref:Integrase catalytic domain-containing protein n=1 Tax=Plectus sambesii TaxID=2011161 RepID=A0A914UTN6_9BILA
MGTETTAQKTIQVLERIFDFCGPCTAIVSDNGPPFNSQEMTVFYNKYIIEHINSPAYHPQSNGLCERFVRSFKEDMQKLKNGGVTNKLKALSSFLRSYRWTPHSTTGIAPAEYFFNRKIRTELACLHPAAVLPSTPVTITNGKFKFAQPLLMVLSDEQIFGVDGRKRRGIIAIDATQNAMLGIGAVRRHVAVDGWGPPPVARISVF